MDVIPVRLEHVAPGWSEPIMATRATPFIHSSRSDGAGDSAREACAAGFLGTGAWMMRSGGAAAALSGQIWPTPCRRRLIPMRKLWIYIIFNAVGSARSSGGERRERYLRDSSMTCGREVHRGLFLEKRNFPARYAGRLPGFPVFNTAELHVDAAVEFALGS